MPWLLLKKQWHILYARILISTHITHINSYADDAVLYLTVNPGGTN